MGLFGNLFGGKKAIKESSSEQVAIVTDVLESLCSLAQFDLSFEIKSSDDGGQLDIEFFGNDEELLIAREGQLLDAIQLYLKRVCQHQIKEQNVNVSVDCGNYREQASASLIELAEKLKGIVLDKGKPVYFRALPPRDRKVIHQYLADDERVKSRSVGDGLYKKIKIYPSKYEKDNRGNRKQDYESDNGDLYNAP